MTDLSQAVSRVDDIFAAFQRGGACPGVAYGVVANGQLVHSSGFGHPTTGSNETPDADSVFRIASMTKSFTATSVLLLRDRGLLRLDDPVGEHVPELRALALPTADSPALTIRHLLTMSGGLPTDDPWGDRQESLAPEPFSALLREGFRFVAAPGTGFEYSNLGYAILGRVIGNVADRAGLVDAQDEGDGHTAYHRFVLSEVLAPLGMAATGYDSAAVGERLVQGHRPLDGGWVDEPFTRPGAFSAMGGLLSSVRDLSRWVTGFLDAFPARDDAESAHPLRRSSRREMQQLSRDAGVTATLDVSDPSVGAVVRAVSVGYGFGLFVEQFTGRGEVISHSGGYPGFGSHMRWHPGSGLGVIALANATYAGPAAPAQAALEALLDHVDAPARTVAPWPDTVAAAHEVHRLLDSFHVDEEADEVDQRADALFAENVDLDQPRHERRVALAQGVELTGDTGAAPIETLDSHGPAHATWSRAGATGSRSVTVRLGPQLEPRVQTLVVDARPHASTELRQVAERVVASISAGDGRWPADLAAGEGLDVERWAFAAGIVRSMGGPLTLDDELVSGDGKQHGVFSLRRAGSTWRLRLHLDDAAEGGTPIVSACSLRPVPVTSTEPVHTSNVQRTQKDS